jgi:hypothetical protein
MSSLTRAASSTSSRETAENPRTVASTPGNPTIRDPSGNASDISLSPSPFVCTPSRRASPPAFRRNSPLYRALGLTTSVRLSLSPHACSTALAAVIVDFPHCRVQFSTPRVLLLSSTRLCCASGPNPSIRRIWALPSSGFAASGRAAARSLTPVSHTTGSTTPVPANLSAKNAVHSLVLQTKDFK